MPNILTAVQTMINTANDNTHGYSQYNRLGPDYDCSSLVAYALITAGFDVNPSSTTWTLESQLRKNGFVDCAKPWKAGDIHLSTNHHVVMSINPEQIAQASIAENGTVHGKTGDQTGNEINIKNYYVPSYGWDVHLRYAGKNDSEGDDDEMTYDTFKEFMDKYNAEKASEGIPKVPADNWQEEAHQWAVDNKISDGYRPHAGATRVEIWGMLRRLCQLIEG